MKKRIIGGLAAFGILAAVTACTGRTGSEVTAEANPESTIEGELTEVSEDNSKQEAMVTPEEKVEEVNQVTETVPDANEEKADSAIDYINKYLGLTTCEDEEELKAIVDEGVYLGYEDFDLSYVGREFTFEELNKVIKDGIFMEHSKSPKISYAVVNYDDTELAAIRYDGMSIYAPDDDSYTVLILSYYDESLHISYSYSTWARSYTELMDNGFVYGDGSGGAGDHFIEGGYIDSTGRYHSIYQIEQVWGSWIADAVSSGRYTSCYTDTGIDAEMRVDVYTINNDKVYTANIEEGSELSEADKSFITITTADGLKWISEEEALKKIAEYEKSLGFPSDFESAGKEIVWTEF